MTIKTPLKGPAKRGLIDGATITPLKKIPDERGAIFHMLRSDAPHFECFGEVYFSKVYPGAIKGWHIHREQTQFYAVPSGMIKLVLFDLRENSRTHGLLQEIFLGEDHYALVRIPTGVANGYKGIGTTPALVANCATHPHKSEGEMDRIDPMSGDIPYDWAIEHK